MWHACRNIEAVERASAVNVAHAVEAFHFAFENDIDFCDGMDMDARLPVANRHAHQPDSGALTDDGDLGVGVDIALRTADPGDQGPHETRLLSLFHRPGRREIFVAYGAHRI